MEKSFIECDILSCDIIVVCWFLFYTCSSLVVVIYIDENYRLLNVLVKFFEFLESHCVYLIITLLTELNKLFSSIKKS